MRARRAPTPRASLKLITMYANVGAKKGIDVSSFWVGTMTNTMSKGKYAVESKTVRTTKVQNTRPVRASPTGSLEKR